MKVVFLFIILSNSAYSQNNGLGFSTAQLSADNANMIGKKSLSNEIAPASDVNNNIPHSMKYSYHEFLDGSVYYVSGKHVDSLRLNYNQFYREMHFVGKDDKIWAIEDDLALRYVRIGSDYYYHDLKGKGYLRIVEAGKKANLLSSQILTVLKYSNPKNGMENRSETFSSSYDSLSNTTFFQNEIITCSKKTIYYLLDERDRIYPANKKGFLKVFHRNDRQIEDHLQQMDQEKKTMRFYREEDLMQLMKFCNSLQSKG